jgi:hypothetical protein
MALIRSSKVSLHCTQWFNARVRGDIAEALIYHVMLRQLQVPQGLARGFELMLYAAMPRLFLYRWVTVISLLLIGLGRYAGPTVKTS